MRNIFISPCLLELIAPEYFRESNIIFHSFLIFIRSSGALKNSSKKKEMETEQGIAQVFNHFCDRGKNIGE